MQTIKYKNTLLKSQKNVKVVSQYLCDMMMVRYKSGLKTRSLGHIRHNKVSSRVIVGHYVSSFSREIIMGPWFKVSSERLGSNSRPLVYKVSSFTTTPLVISEVMGLIRGFSSLSYETLNPNPKVTYFPIF